MTQDSVVPIVPLVLTVLQNAPHACTTWKTFYLTPIMLTSIPARSQTTADLNLEIAWSSSSRMDREVVTNAMSLDTGMPSQTLVKTDLLSDSLAA
jgi:hypothetical protein